MNIWFCAYRDWATEILDAFPEMKCIKSPKEFKANLQYIDSTDLIFFVGWSWIIDAETVSKYNCICMHPSKLPRYRGGTPLQHQIIAGEETSAVTLFLMNDKIDAGKILFQRPLSLGGELDDIFNRIVISTKEGIKSIISSYDEDGTLHGAPQDLSGTTYFKRRTPEMSEIEVGDFTKNTAKEVYNKIRALADPYPNAYVRCADGKKLYIQRAYCEE